MSEEWLIGLDDDIVVTLLKHLNEGTITWNSHFTDPSYGDLANKRIVQNPGTRLIFKIRYSWNDAYGDNYNTYRIWIEKKTDTGSWTLIPNGYHQPNSSELGNPAIHSAGSKDFTYEIIADDKIVDFRIKADVAIGRGHDWNHIDETRYFQIRVGKCCCSAKWW
ncbi:hypothetical protein ES705_08715 [subsurface metagenome]